MILYYQELDGDYLAVNHDTKGYYRAIGQRDIREGRATAIINNLWSMSTTGISIYHLRRNCRRVPKSKVPKAWLRAIGYTDPSS